MDATFHALGALLVKATFTIIVLVMVHFYLRVMFFSPLDRILKQRHDMTEGARAAAQASIKHAEERAAEYEAKLREARAEVLREQEAARQKWLADQNAQIEQARAKARELMHRTSQEIHEESQRALVELARESESLAEEICQAVLHGAVS